MARRTGKLRKLNRVLSTLTLLFLSLLFYVNLPFYSGSTLGPTLSWRMEGARLNILRRPAQNPEPFYIALNSEPLRWNWDAHYHAPNDWFIRIPLWTPLLIALVWCIAAWWPARRRHDPSDPRCKSCGYSLRNLPPGSPCPECGPERAKTP